jgi:DNA polymerase-3 subunit epsilon/ATP-dependent DNA helicase DinG
MRGDLVAIDLETTGLDPLHDAIIEVGAVRLRDGKVIDEFSSLIDPGRPIPHLITNITGIRSQDVIGAPTITAVVPALREFIGHAPIIGHNVGFDAAFLVRQGLVQTNPRIDTYDLASILMPTAARYSLTALTGEIEIDLENAHRALDDARAAGLLYYMLWERLLRLPFDLLMEINVAAQDLAWEARFIFDAALRDRLAAGEVAPAIQRNLAGPFQPDEHERRPLHRVEQTHALDEDDVSAVLQSGGPLAGHLPAYEFRDQQVRMARAIAQSFSSGQHLMIEAGTGTGKSVGYLVPAILWSTLNQERVVIATNTINLQDQLIEKDVPMLQASLGIDFTASVLKGRGNYLCPRRLAAVRQRRPTSVDELRTLAKILVWLLDSDSGDRGELTLRGPIENATWQRLSAEDENCSLDRCAAQMMGACPFYKARKAAEAANIVIVNHALLISDAMTDNRVMPEYNYVVVDEAHHLEEATTNGLSFRIDESGLRRRLADLGGPRRGLLGSLLQSARAGASERDAKRLQSFVEMISDVATAMEVHVVNWFAALRAFGDDVLGNRQGDYSTQLRITEDVRSRLSFNRVQHEWQTLGEFFEGLSAAMDQLAGALERMRGYNLPDFEDLVSSAGAAARYLEEVYARLRAFATNPDSNTIYWLNFSQEVDNLSLHMAPLHVGEMVNQYLWAEKQSVVMTSATLQTNNSFDYLRERLHAEEVESIALGSPFNYKESTLIYVPNDIPDPNERKSYQHAVERGIIELAAALNGRVLALFTSFAQLRETGQAVTPRLALGNITVYDQSDGSSRQALLDGFRSSERAVLLGTRSFWEGVDIPGDSLSALVIVRLPFAVPSDPVFAARSETYSNSFTEYALPDAILRFRQGFGRLIRTATDRGIVTIFDSRIVKKAYGSNFITSLPDCTVQYGSLDFLPMAATEWLSERKV